VSDWGTIEAGLSADLVLLEGNPLDDITATRRIAGVMRAGRWWSGTGRQELLDGLRKGAQR
jgi:imidazolonepropionase-like amidohydrolase